MAEERIAVLLVEDDEDDALLVREYLAESRSATCTISWVRTSGAAVHAVREAPYQVILVDYRLGPDSGVDLIRTLIAQGCTAAIILLTGVGSPLLDAQAIEAGAIDYLPKAQLTTDVLERAIRHAIAHKRTQLALESARDELERRVRERTAELVETNVALRKEIHERERAEEALRRSERIATLATAAAKLAHEIGNPLNGLSTTVQLMARELHRQGAIDHGTMQESVQDLTQELARLQSLLQNWRALARQAKPDVRPLALASLVAEVLRPQQPYYEKLGIVLHEQVPPDLPPVLADANGIAQVLLNLCKNAIEAMPTGGILSVHAARGEDGVRLTISDSGHGIPEGFDVFEPFATTKDNGTGLGLAIVRQIVLAHDGTITFTSQRGEGTAFVVTLPLAPHDEPSSVQRIGNA